jgi:hypothetical protein
MSLSYSAEDMSVSWWRKLRTSSIEATHDPSHRLQLQTTDRLTGLCVWGIGGWDLVHPLPCMPAYTKRSLTLTCWRSGILWATGAIRGMRLARMKTSRPRLCSWQVPNRIVRACSDPCHPPCMHAWKHSGLTGQGHSVDQRHLGVRLSDVHWFRTGSRCARCGAREPKLAQG